MLAPPQARPLGARRGRPSRGRQHGQQCFPCAESRAKYQRGEIFYWITTLMRHTSLVKRGLLGAHFASPIRPILGHLFSAAQCQGRRSRAAVRGSALPQKADQPFLQSIVSSVPTRDVLRTPPTRRGRPVWVDARIDPNDGSCPRAVISHPIGGASVGWEPLFGSASQICWERATLPFRGTMASSAGGAAENRGRSGTPQTR